MRMLSVAAISALVLMAAALSANAAPCLAKYDRCMARAKQDFDARQRCTLAVVDKINAARVAYMQDKPRCTFEGIQALEDLEPPKK